MIKNTTEMYKVKEVFRSIMDEEYELCDKFDSYVDYGMIDMNTLSKIAMDAKQPNLHRDEIEKVNKEDIMSNPYLANIKVPKVSSKNFGLSNSRMIQAGTIAKYKCKTRDLETMRRKNGYLVCDRPLRFPALVEGERKTSWMTVEPFEIETFKEIVEEATGDVLLIGCGLGYAAYMISEKEDVKSVTIVDMNQEVLDLFSEHILPQFGNKEKIKVQQGDGIEYLKTADLSEYDYVNVDVWYDTVDMIYPYLRCLEIEKANPQTKFSYWLEDELKEVIQKSIISAVGNAKVPANKKSSFMFEGFLFEKIGEDVVNKTPLNNYNDVYNLVNIPNIRDFLFEWYANNLETVERQEPIDRGMINGPNSNIGSAASKPKTFIKGIL